MSRLQLRHLRLAYGPTAAVRDLSLDLAPGRITALLGPSGCGKSTTLRIVAGLLRPDGGDVLLDGRAITPLPPEKRDVVMVFQDHLLFPSMTVAGNLAFGLKMRGTPRREIGPKVEAMLARVQLAGLGPRRPADLSGGQAQRVALARALILEPKVLLLDEPLSSLDAGLRDDMRELIRELQAEAGITTLLVTHDQEEAVALAHEIALMSEGRLLQSGPPEDFYRRPASAAVARFFGGVNFLPGRVAGQTFHGPFGPLPLMHPAAPGPGLLTIRPEAIQTGPKGRPAKVTDLRYLGNRTRMTVDLDGTPLIVDTPPLAAAAVGETLRISLPTEALWVLPPD